MKEQTQQQEKVIQKVLVESRPKSSNPVVKQYNKDINGLMKE